MKITWIEKVEDLPKDVLVKIWEVLQEINGKLKIEAPSNLIYFPSYQESDDKARILKQLEEKEMILKIKKTDSGLEIKINKEKFEALYKKTQNKMNTTQEQNIEFDSLTSVISKGSERYAIQSKLRKKLFSKLWEERQVGKKIGKPFPKSALAVQVDLVTAASDFNHNEKAKEILNKEITEMNRIFKNKDFSLKIESKGGVMLIEKT